MQVDETKKGTYTEVQIPSTVERTPKNIADYIFKNNYAYKIFFSAFFTLSNSFNIIIAKKEQRLEIVLIITFIIEFVLVLSSK